MNITIHNKTFSCNEHTTFSIQVGKGKGSYKDKYVFVGKLNQALFYYQCINIGNGYKKRLLIDNQVVSRVCS
jgi:hypothetical protein